MAAASLTETATAEQPQLRNTPRQAPASPIRVSGLNHAFGEGDARKQVLFDIDLEAKRGELVVLMCACGSGQTTLLTLIGRLRDVQEGDIRLLGQELDGADEETLVRCRRTRRPPARRRPTY